LIFFIGGFPYEWWIEICNELFFSIDLFYVLSDIAENLIIFLHFNDKVIELIFDGFNIDVGLAGGTLLWVVLFFVGVDVAAHVEGVGAFGSVHF
jgi:hypothetical protein